MTNTFLIKNSQLILANTLTVQMDPLEQFDVLAISLPIVGNVGFTNLALLLALNVVVMAC